MYDRRVLQCPACQRENRRDARFCLGCGARLAARCSACGRELPRNAAFCDGCGQAIAPPAGAQATVPAPSRDPRAYTPRHLAERILTSRSALEGERKHVTVLFADLSGFTPLSESRDPEQMHGLMDRCFQLVLEQVHHYEGTVNQFLGDGGMALFGAPVALEEGPRRAVMAALAIQRALAEMGETDRDGAELRMRIGIHSGLVVVGRSGDDLRMDYTAVGDTTNLAARLQELAPPGEILISEATGRAVAGFFDLEDGGAREVRGKSEPVRVYRVLAERAVRSRIDAVADTGLTPLVGRERELAELRIAFEAAREGRGQVVFLVGEAGLGKSRLLYEFRNRLGDEPHTWFEGRCASYGSSTAFQSIVDGLRRTVGIEDRDDDAAALAKLEQSVARVGDDLAWTLPFLQKLLSLPVCDPAVEELDAMLRRSETIKALHALLLRLSLSRPLVLVIEDLHWIDAASEEFLEFLVDSIPAAHCCLVLTHRPGYAQPFGDRSYHVRVALRALTGSQMAAMAGALLDAEAVPAELRGLIADKAEGNPFFVEEVTKSLLEQGALRVEGGRVELTRGVAEISVPDSIQDVLMARIDRLDEQPKRAIQVASVIGREFALRLLERISEMGDSVGQVVGELRALELIYEKAAYPELAFMFKHALTHDVAYQSMLLQRRKALHRIVGLAIEELYRERLAEHYESLAHHFTLAEEWERALDYCEKAARKARDAYANHSAAEHYRRALAICEQLGDAVPDERRRVLAEALGQACTCTSDLPAAGEAFRRAADWSAEPALRARNLGWSGYTVLWAHDYDRAEATTAEALALATSVGSEAARAIALVTQGLQLGATRGLAAWAKSGHGEEVLRAAERSGDPEVGAVVFSQVGLWEEMQGDYRRAIELCERALASARSAGSPYFVIQARWSMGMAFSCLGEYGRGIAALQEALDLCNCIGDRAFKARLLNTLGWCYAELGAHQRASEYNRQATDLAGEMVELALVAGAPEIHANAAVNLAGNRIALGDIEAALELLEPLHAELDRPGDPWQRWRYALHIEDALARAELARGNAERALSLVTEELEGARKNISKKIEARALELRGRVFANMDRRDEAAQSLEAALEVARAIGYPPVVWRALSLRAELSRRAGKRRQGERQAGEARALVEKLAGSIPEVELQREFAALGERLVDDPLGAYR